MAGQKFVDVTAANARLSIWVQGCSILKNPDIIEYSIKVHTVLKKLKTNIFDIVFTQNVEGKTSQLGEDIRINPNTRFIFAHRHIADIMVSVLYAPMIADGLTQLLSVQNDG